MSTAADSTAARDGDCVDSPKSVKRVRVSEQADDEPSAVLSKKELLEVFEGDTIAKDMEFFQDMMSTTKTAFQDRLRELDSFLLEESWIKLSKVCHTIKGSSAMLQLEQLRQASMKAEELCKEVHCDEDTLRAALAQVRRELLRMIKTDFISFSGA